MWLLIDTQKAKEPLPVAHKYGVEHFCVDLWHSGHGWEGHQPFWFAVLVYLLQWLHVSNKWMELS